MRSKVLLIASICIWYRFTLNRKTLHLTTTYMSLKWTSIIEKTKFQRNYLKKKHLTSKSNPQTLISPQSLIHYQKVKKWLNRFKFKTISSGRFGITRTMCSTPTSSKFDSTFIPQKLIFLILKMFFSTKFITECWRKL